MNNCQFLAVIVFAKVRRFLHTRIFRCNTRLFICNMEEIKADDSKKMRHERIAAHLLSGGRINECWVNPVGVEL